MWYGNILIFWHIELKKKVVMILIIYSGPSDVLGDARIGTDWDWKARQRCRGLFAFIIAQEVRVG